MKCPQCQHENREGDKFCRECGTRLPSVCPHCGNEVSPQDRFCAECGASLIVGARRAVPVEDETVPKLEDMQKQLQSRIPQSLADRLFAGAKQMQGEYRLVTAVFADVSGSSGMAREMPLDQYVETMNDCFKMMVDTISIKYEGSINRFIGDCVLAFFGAPITHENDAERAILAALDIRDGVKELNLDVSIGINTGMTYVGEMGSDLYFERSAWGPDVDFARRLQEAAGPGEIYVGAATYRLTSRIFDFEKPIHIEVKAMEERQVAYPVLRVREHPEKLRGIEGLRARMIGREREFADLKEAADNLISGRGSIVTVIGEAGLGKSRLALELKEYLRDKDVSWYEGRSVSIGQTVSYWPFLDILRTYVNVRDVDDGKSPHPPLQRGSKETVPLQRESKGGAPLQGGELSESEFAGKLRESIIDLFPQRSEDILPFLGNLLSIKFGDELDDKLAHFTPEQIRHQTLMRLRDVFTAVSLRKPLLLILEDLHWSDDLSLDLVSLLMDELAANPLMLLCIYRPEREHRCWQISDVASRKCLERYTEIMLRKLSAVQSRQLVESLLEIENLPESTKDMVLKKSEGNPFFIEEVIRSLIDRDLVYREDDRWKARREIADIDVPDTIQSVLLSRVDRLQAETRYVLQCASVIGRLFRYRLLDHLAQHERDLEAHLSQLEERDLVYEERSVPELEYAFKHALTQEATYQGILERKRREFHHQVGEGIETLYRDRLAEYYEELAYHYSRSADKEKALDYLIKAGDKSKALYSNQQAIDYYTRAMKLAEEFPGERKEQRLSILEGFGDIYYLIGKYDEAIQSYEDALNCCEDRKKRADINRKIGMAYAIKAEPDLALKYIDIAIDELGEDTESVEMARICNDAAHAFISPTMPTAVDKALDYGLRSLSIVEGTENKRELAEACTWLGIIYSIKDDFDKSTEYSERGLSISQEIDDALLMGSAYCALALTYQELVRDWDAAIDYRKKSMELFEKIGNSRCMTCCYFWLGSAYESAGDADMALQCFKRGVELDEERKWPYPTEYTLVSLSQSYMDRSEWDEAIKYAQQAVQIAATVSSTRLANSLGAAEEVYETMGQRAEFIPFCHKMMEENAEKLQGMKLTQWYLEPKELSGQLTQITFLDEFDGSALKPSMPSSPRVRGEVKGWQWVNPTGDCSYELNSRPSWLEIRAAFGCDLWSRNLNAPRLLQEIAGDFAIETKIAPASKDIPTIGGLVIWKDADNFIRFERGMHGENEIGLSSNVGSKRDHFGRGMLVSEIIYLRIERIGDTFSAYCSSNGENWLTCGEVSFPAEDPIQVGVHAIGYVGGRGGRMATATRFDYFKVLRRHS